MTGVWAGFITAVLLLLALDLGVFHRQAKVVSVREAIGWSAGWIALALAFAVFVYFAYDRHWSGLGIVPDPVDGLLNTGARAGEKYLTGHAVEKSLTGGNIFVIAMICRFLRGAAALPVPRAVPGHPRRPGPARGARPLAADAETRSPGHAALIACLDVALAIQWADAHDVAARLAAFGSFGSA